MCNSVKVFLYYILILFSSKLVAQDTTAYILFNSAYSETNYRLLDSACSYKLNPSHDSLFIQACSQVVPKASLRSILDKESKPFKWDQSRLRNATIISDSIALKHDIESLRLSAPIFDQTKTYAVIFERYDALSCIHVGPVLLQYKDKKWNMIESWINSYNIVRGHTISK